MISTDVLPRLSVLLLFALLTACGDSDTRPPTSAAEPATPATRYIAPADSAGFHIAELEGFSQYGRPAVAVRFSSPLAQSQNFDQLLDLQGADGERPNGSWQLREDNSALMFPYLEADRSYRLRVDAGLSSAAGDTLGQAFEHEVYSGPQPPMLGFASQGNVLPGRDGAGLPVITVNVSEADIEFLRVRERSLPRFLADYQRNGPRGSWQLGSLAAMADSVYSARFALRADANQRTLNHIPVRDIAELSTPGAYFAVMRAAGRFEDSYETALFFVSDIGLHARLHRDELFVHAASLTSAGALGNIELSLVDEHGKTLAAVQTDAQGQARLPMRPKREHLLLARARSDFALLSFRQPALDLSAFDLAGRHGGGERDVYLWAGRDLFRPGEEVRMHGLLRDYDGRPVSASPLFLSLKQPNGRVYARDNGDVDELGYFEWRRLLPEDVPTGRWRLEARLDPNGVPVGEFELRIEEFLPERLKLELDSPVATLAPGQALPLRAEGAYLYGAPAAGNRFLAELSFEHAPALVESLKGFRFGDPTEKLPRPDEPALDVRLDATGQINAELALPGELPATSPVAVFVRGSVFESGGRAVARTIKRSIWPASDLVGVRPLFDMDEGAAARSTIAFELLRSNAGGEQSAGEVKIVLRRDRRDHVWTRDPELGWKIEYTSNWETVGPAQTVALNTDTAVRYENRVEWGDYQLEVTDTANGLITRLPFFAGWRGDDENQGEAARPDKVKLALDRSTYRAGDRIALTITAPHPGHGVLLVEAGERLLDSREIRVREGGSTVELTVLPEWERHDIYLSAVVFRAGSAREKITPNRALGIVHLPIDRSERTVAASLSASERARPGEELVVVVHAPDLAGQQAMATISAVDQGILNITRYPVPDAAGHFFAARGYAVDAYDLYGKVIEHRDGHGARLSYGGDLALTALPQARRPTAKVATVDLFSGPVQLDGEGRASVRLNLPDFNGRLRLTALVYSAERYGSAESAVEVRAPLVAEISSPRVMAPGDRSQVTLDLHNLSGRDQNLSIEVSAQPPLRVDNGVRVLRIADEQRSVLDLPLIALPGQDVGRLRVRVTGDGIDLDRRFELLVRPGWGQGRSSRLDQLPAGSPIQISAEALAPYLPGSGQLALSVSRQPPVPFTSAVRGLIAYPYGCLEQTTSRAFPLALLDADSAQRLAIPELGGDSRRQALADALARISAMQLGNGHFSFWGGESIAQSQLTPFVAEFLLEAREAGQAIPEPVLDKALERLHEDLLAGGDRYYNYENSEALRFSVRAHAGYVLARQARAPLGTLRAMQQHERNQARSMLALVHLGLALHLQGDTERGIETLQQAFANPPQRPRYLGDYGSELRDRALALTLLRQHDLRVPGADGELLALARSLAGGEHGRRHLSTQEQLALFRLGRQLRRAGAGAVTGTIQIGDNVEAIAAGAMYARLFDEPALTSGIELNVEGDGVLYVVREAVGVPRSPPAADSSGVSIRRDWFGMDGRPFRGQQLREGEAVIVRLTVEAEQQLDDLLVVDYLPGGLEPENLNLGDARLLERLNVDGVQMDQRWGVDIRHEEYRDDRYAAALRVWAGQTAQLYYIARAVSPGEFTVPPPQAEDMYRPELRAVGSSRPSRLVVTAPDAGGR